MRITQHAGFRRPLTGAALLGGSLLLVASAVLARPSGAQDAAGVLAAARDQGGAFLAQALLETGGFLLVFAGAIGATQVLRRRGVVLGNLACFLCFAGLAGFMLVGATSLNVYALANGDDHAAMVAAADVVHASPAAIMSFPLMLLGMVGLILLALGLRRARLVPLWVPLVAVAGVVLDFVGGTSHAALLTSDVLALVSFGWIAKVAFSTSDDVWDAGTDPGAQAVGSSSSASEVAGAR
jgi:hypothetical protein